MSETSGKVQSEPSGHDPKTREAQNPGSDPDPGLGHGSNSSSSSNSISGTNPQPNPGQPTSKHPELPKPLLAAIAAGIGLHIGVSGADEKMYVPSQPPSPYGTQYYWRCAARLEGIARKATFIPTLF